MLGRQTTFKKVLADFEFRLQNADFVAIDTELTGVDLEDDPDSFEESGAIRLDKVCRIAERYTMIQLGITVVGKRKDGDALTCTSYNIFAFPYVGPEMPRRGFYCQASALQFNAQHRVNFNMWIGEGVPYMSREDETKYMRNGTSKTDGNHVDEKLGILRLWKLLCAARLPFVVHCPLDLFFLLSAFECRSLPRHDPRAMAALIRKCTPKVYDTAYLHGAMGCYKRLGLMKYFEDVQARYEELASNGLSQVPNVEFELQGDTAGRYSKPSDELAHEAGFDSLVTAQLFAYLRAISPGQVKEGANKLFLYRSVEYLDLDRAAFDGMIANCIYDVSRVTLLVAVLDPIQGLDAPRHIAAAGFTYRWMDTTHVLVVLRASGGAAVRKAAELAAKAHGVQTWLPFDEWRERAQQIKSNSVRTIESRHGLRPAAPINVDSRHIVNGDVVGSVDSGHGANCHGVNVDGVKGLDEGGNMPRAFPAKTVSTVSNSERLISSLLARTGTVGLLLGSLLLAFAARAHRAHQPQAGAAAISRAWWMR